MRSVVKNDSKEKLNQLEHWPVKKLLWHFALPAVVGNMVNSLYNIIDRMFIGQGVGALAISGLTITFPILIFLQAFGMLIGAGASARISIMLGQKRIRSAEELLGTAFLLSLLFSVSTILLCMLFMDALLLRFGASADTLVYAKEYLMIALPGNLFANIAFSYNAVMRSSGYPKQAMYAMLAGALLNIALDALFIYGFRMGIRGAAFATVLAMFASMLIVLAHFRKKESLLRLRLSTLKLKLSYTKDILSIGIAPFSMQFTASLIAILLNNSLSYYGGDLAVGAYGILNSYALLLVMLCIGISRGMQPIVGFNYGANRIDRVKDVFFLAAKANFLIGLVGAAVAMLVPELLVKSFTKDPEMIAITTFAIRVTLVLFMGVGIQISITQYFQSIGHAKKAIFLSLSRQVLFLVPLLLILPHYFGLHGVWFSLPISDFLAIITAVCLFILHYKHFILPTLEQQNKSSDL